MVKGTDKTAGQLINENAQKEPESIDMRDVLDAAQQDYAKKVKATIQEGIEKFKRDFFVVCEGKVERIFQSTIRNFIKLALFCPTPHFGQTVYHYDFKKEKLEMLWSVPDKPYAEYLRTAFDIESDAEKQLRNDVIDFYENKLILKADKYNNQENAMKRIEEIYG